MNCSHFSPQVKLFFRRKSETYNFRIRKCDHGERNKKSLTFFILKNASKIFGKITLKPL